MIVKRRIHKDNLYLFLQNDVFAVNHGVTACSTGAPAPYFDYYAGVYVDEVPRVLIFQPELERQPTDDGDYPEEMEPDQFVLVGVNTDDFPPLWWEKRLSETGKWVDCAMYAYRSAIPRNGFFVLDAGDDDGRV